MTAAPLVTQRITHDRAWDLYDAASSREIERHAQTQWPAHTLMQRAGRAVADLALAIAPHSQRIWIACGPGNNGGDGLEAAIHLHRWGKSVHVTWLGRPDHAPADARHAYTRMIEAGVSVHTSPPRDWDLAIDALLGLGCTRAPQNDMAAWLEAMQTRDVPLLHVDLPSGLSADTGVWHGRRDGGRATRHTLALLTLKPGLFTADGRDASAQVWFNDLGVSPNVPVTATQASITPTAHLQASVPHSLKRRHNSHKGSYGDVIVLGGASGMCGAALLAAHAALRFGAGRVLVGLLDEHARSLAATQHPSLMLRDIADLPLRDQTVVCGCGGGDAVRKVLPRVLSSAFNLVLDADGLNALQDSSLWQQLTQRHARGWATVLTPHPLEAARLLKCETAQVQQDRLWAARELARLTHAVVVLKGSGTVIAETGQTPIINPTGNARLASAGSGDVLAGMVAALMAQGLSASEAACTAVARHGDVADHWPMDLAFDAYTMTQRL